MICAFRRGRKFGTIVVDLQTHKVIDVLPDRTAETLAAWMQKHPEIEIVSRDPGRRLCCRSPQGGPSSDANSR
jgi:transposase